MNKAQLESIVWKTKYHVRHRWPDQLQRWVPTKMPRWLVYRVVIMAYAKAWTNAGDKHPDELTFREVLGPWEGRGQ